VNTACRAQALLYTQNHGLSPTTHPNGIKIVEYWSQAAPNQNSLGNRLEHLIEGAHRVLTVDFQPREVLQFPLKTAVAIIIATQGKGCYRISNFILHFDIFAAIG
jgi:hypothetical protein